MSEGHEVPIQQRAEREQPIPGLSEVFGTLRDRGVGRPIAVGARGKNGELTSDTTFVGHILPSNPDSKQQHAVILDTGDAAEVRQGVGGGEEYRDIYGGEEILLYPPGTGRDEIFSELTAAQPRGPKNGGFTYESTASRFGGDLIGLKEVMQEAANATGGRIHIGVEPRTLNDRIQQAAVGVAAEERDTPQQEVGKFAVAVLNAAIEPF